MKPGEGVGAEELGKYPEAGVLVANPSPVKTPSIPPARVERKTPGIRGGGRGLRDRAIPAFGEIELLVPGAEEDASRTPGPKPSGGWCRRIPNATHRSERGRLGYSGILG